ncbi:MAG TPA: hypothetical protein VF502_03000 [Stellaceae bacterium]
MYVRNREPSVDELLNDPVMQLIMARNGLSDEAVRALIADLKRRLQAQFAAADAAESAPAGS